MVLPKDEYSSGNSDYQCYANLFAETCEELEIKIQEYLNWYPPQGYGTSVGKIYEHPDGYLCVRINRWHSCD